MSDERFRKDERPLAEIPLGYEWQPKLFHFMELNPWPDSAFVYETPTTLPDRNGVQRPIPEGFDFAAHRASAYAAWKESWKTIPTPEAKAAWAAEHAENLDRARDVLEGCGVKIGDDVLQLGCTGVIATPGYTGGDVQFLRMALAGSGLGLPCFVPPTRYCLGHQAIGGLQLGQKSLHPEFVEAISRELTPDESKRMEMIEKLRGEHAGENFQERLAHTAVSLTGMERDLAQPLGGDAASVPTTVPRPQLDIHAALEAARARHGGGREEPGPEASALHAPMEPYVKQNNFVCLDHNDKIWTCRYCVAELIVMGDLVPQFLIDTPGTTHEYSADQVNGVIDGESADSAKLAVIVARYVRKLAKV